MRNNTIATNPLARYVLAALLGTSSIASQAATCNQKDLAGNWRVSGLSTVPFGGADVSFTSFCKIKVSNTGAFSQTSASCNSSSGKTTMEGSMKFIGNSCSVRAFPMKVFFNGVQAFTFTVDFMALDKGKTTFTATGNKDAATTGNAQFIWQGVKQ